MHLRQTCQLVCSILLIVRNHQASNFSRNRNHFFKSTTRETLMTRDPSMKDRISSGVPMGIRRRAYPSPLTGPSPSCSHASCKASTHSCSKRLRITMLQADDSSYNSNLVITQSGREMGCCVILSIIPRERCLHNETIWSPTASYFVSRRYYP